MNKTYIGVTQEAGRAFFQNPPKGPIVMLNLLRFKEVADYGQYPELAPDEEISGAQAYRLYMKHTTPYLEAAGGELLFYGKSNSFLIGPETEKWDIVMLVKHASAVKFLEFARNEGYLKGAGHRTAALLDSRLLPIEQKELG